MVSLLVACRSTRPIQSAMAKRDSAQSATAPAKTDSLQLIQSVQHRLSTEHVPFETFSAKVAVDYRGSEGKNYNVNANIRMQHDSAIWISVNAVLGIEAASTPWDCEAFSRPASSRVRRCRST